MVVSIFRDRFQAWLQSIRPTFLNALVIALTTLVFLICLSLLWRIYGNNPPIMIHSLESDHIGFLCPGEERLIPMHIIIREPVITHYFISVNRLPEKSNVLGTQKVFTDMLHPEPAEFTAAFPWTVPELPPGEYKRVFASRNVAGNQKTVWATTLFDIAEEGENCP
jgi:hypothetical protein